MEVVNKNVESKNMTLEYLKQNKSCGSNKHEEKEFEHLIASVVLITTNSLNKINYNVCITCIEKNTNTIFDNIKSKDFEIETEANNYYNNLKDFIDSINEEKLYQIINDKEEK